MKVAIIGHGFVGKALENGLNEDLETLIIDPIYGNNLLDLQNFNPEITFICVPTPMSDGGKQNLHILNDVITEINTKNIKGEIVIKSTVLPDGIIDISESIPNFIYNPEFLTERNAFDDFINADSIIIGGKKEKTEMISSFYKKHTKCKSKKHIHTDLISASLIKYTINSFLASKVIFFNELYNLFKKSGANLSWDDFADAVSSDSRIGSSHMKVPGPDGRFGFGGACFPKDSKALYEYSLSLESPLQVLEKVIEINNDIRSSYDSASEREIGQNISFPKNE